MLSLLLQASMHLSQQAGLLELLYTQGGCNPQRGMQARLFCWICSTSPPRVQACPALGQEPCQSSQKTNTHKVQAAVKPNQHQVMAAQAADNGWESLHSTQATDATQTSPRKLKMLELFSGLGGMHSCVARAMAEEVALDVVAIDINMAANEIYALNFQNTAMPTDLEKITAAQLDAYAAKLWTLSPPCQPYTSTTCSRQLDTHDSRAASFVNLMRQLPLMKSPPKYMMLENVAGFIGSKGNQLLLQTLTANGYNVQQFLLSPEQFGVPYLRPRYFALAKRSPLTFTHSFPSQIIRTLPPLIPQHLAVRCMPPTLAQAGLAQDQYLHAMTPDCLVKYMSINHQRTTEQPDNSQADQGYVQELGDMQVPLPCDKVHDQSLQSYSHLGILHMSEDQLGAGWTVPLAAWQRYQQQLQQHDSNPQPLEAVASSHGNVHQHTNDTIVQQRNNGQILHIAQPYVSTETLPSSATQQLQAAGHQPDSTNGAQRVNDNVQPPNTANQTETAVSKLRTPVGTEFCHTLGFFLDSSSSTEGDTSLWQRYALGDKTLAKWWKVLDVVTADSRHCNCITKHYSRNLIGAGSVLATREFANTFCRVDPRGRTHIPRDPFVVAQELGPTAYAILKEIRFLSPSEVSKLHGLEQGFRFNDSASAHTAIGCLGNSLSVDVCAWLAVALLT